jgi:putative transposase
MCRVMKINSGCYYKWKKQPIGRRALEGVHLKLAITRVFKVSDKTYGSPRIRQELKSEGFVVSRKRVAKLMKEEGLQSKIRKQWKVTTNSSHRYSVAQNLLAQNFVVSRPDEVWVSDITYIKTSQGWLYLTVVIDLWDRAVVGWSLSKTMFTKDTVIPAWKMAHINRKITEPLMFHSDRCIQYACKAFTNYLKSNPLVKQSMSRKGNCWDNAVAESFFKTIKTELIYHHKYKTRMEAELQIFKYIETWYNKKRRHSALNGKSILEFNQINNMKSAA